MCLTPRDRLHETSLPNRPGLFQAYNVNIIAFILVRVRGAQLSLTVSLP